MSTLQFNLSIAPNEITIVQNGASDIYQVPVNPLIPWPGVLDKRLPPIRASNIPVTFVNGQMKYNEYNPSTLGSGLNDKPIPTFPIREGVNNNLQSENVGITLSNYANSNPTNNHIARGLILGAFPSNSLSLEGASDNRQLGGGLDSDINSLPQNISTKNRDSVRAQKLFNITSDSPTNLTTRPNKTPTVNISPLSVVQ